MFHFPRVYRVGGTACLALVAGLCQPGGALAQRPTEALIVAARERAAAYQVVSLRWSEVRTVPKSASERLLAGTPAAREARGANLDLKLQGEFTIDAVGRLRIHATGELPTLVDGKIQPGPHESLMAFDGLELKTFTPPGPVEHAQGFVTRKRKPIYAEPKFWPILTHYRWFSKVELPQPLDCRPESLSLKESPKDGGGELGFRHTYPIPNTKLTFYSDFVADPHQSYRVSRIQHGPTGGLTAQVDIEYGSQGGATVPVRWTVQEFRPGIGLVATTQVEISETSLNPDLGSEFFSFSFPAGTRLVDSDTGDVSIIKADSSERKLTSAELQQQLSNAEILANDSRQASRRWRWVLAITAILVVGVASVWAWRRTRSRT